jgi:UDP-galactopyranose mutase
MKFLVVGAGFAGCTIARVIAEAGYAVDIIDQRPHIGGNAYDYTNEHGIRIHKYGPHYFHTNNKDVFEWLSRFTAWTKHEQKVLALLKDGTYVPFPVNTTTLKKIPKEKVFDTFFEPYSKKMWGKYYDELDKSVFNRVKTKDTDDDRYYADEKYQFVPKFGYVKLFENMLCLSNIRIKYNQKFDKTMEKKYDHIFNSMAIDEYYDYCYGKLPYRSIKFDTLDVELPKVIPTTNVNFTYGPCTRVTEWKNIPNHGTNEKITTLTFETPCDPEDIGGEKYYPVITEKNRELYKKYKDIKNDKMTFIGRCGLYTYLDMHQVVSSSLTTAKKFLEEMNDNSRKIAA